MPKWLRCIFTLAAILVLLGPSWSFETRNPPKVWKNVSGALYFYVDPWFPINFRSAADQAAFSWSSTGALWTFWFGGSRTGVSYDPDVQDGLNVIDFGPPRDSDARGETVLFFSLADENRIIEADTVLNDAFPFATSGEPGAYDVQTVVLHELGHWLELLHSDNPGDVMYRTIGVGEVKRSLSNDDRDGIRFLYPSPGAASGGGSVCKRIGACRTCRNADGSGTISISFSLRKREKLESYSSYPSEEINLTLPQPRGPLARVYRHGRELGRLFEEHETLADVWDPQLTEWIPGLYWLSGDLVRGRNEVITARRTAELIRAIEVTQAVASPQLRRDLEGFKRFLRTNTGKSLEQVRLELFSGASAAR
jgi:hypothetical protein